MQEIITTEGTNGHTRLKYFRSTPATSEYWDKLWAELEDTTDYSRSIAGDLPWFLKKPVKTWVRPGSRILEAGCGRAHFSVAAHALGYQAEALDYAPDVVARVGARFPHLRIFSGDVRNLNRIESGRYDAVYSPGVCEHFEEGPEPILCESNRILKLGGILIVSTPCFNSFRRTLARFGMFRGAPRGEFYQYAFSPKEMVEILERIGFEVLQVRLHGTLKTLRDHVRPLQHVRLGPLERFVAVALDVLPITNRWGHACVWVARKRSD